MLDLNAVQDRDQRLYREALRLWREANPSSDLVRPSRAMLMEWLLAEVERLLRGRG